ncbi:MAG: hypothetical protein IPO27_14295 [Bacteroidetes bacterium]|nr:hypothetical protein [Bacteroidota bacterium]
MATYKLTWPTPTDTYDVFSDYMIYHANNIAGPYALLDSIQTLAQGNYTHVGANGQNMSNFYYLQSRIDCNGLKLSQPGDTVSAIRLNAVNGGGGLANLTWNAIRTPLLSSSSQYYHIWMEYPLGTWNMIDSTTATSYTDTVNITICEDSVNYRIEILDSLGCASVSNIDGATFQNFSQPDAPSLRCLVSDNSGSVTLSWVAPVDTSFSFDGYFISSAPALGGPYTVIDSVKNYAITSYTDINANIMSGPIYYFVQALTTCGPSFSLGSDTLQAMRLNVTNVANNANLAWNALHLPKLSTSNAYYHVYKEYPLGTWTLIDSTQVTTYIDPLNQCNDTINYRIELTDLSGCISKSTIDGERFLDNTIPDPPGLRCINVNANGSTSLTWVADPDTGLAFNSYHIYLANNAAGPYTVIDSIFNYNTLTYTDNSSNAYAGDLFYFLKSRTGCGSKYSPEGDTLQAIRLNLVNNGGQFAQLTWNAIRTPLLSTSNGAYDVYKEYPQEPGQKLLLRQICSITTRIKSAKTR